MRNPFRSRRATAARPFEPAPASEVDDELAFHLEERVRALIAGGMEPAAARHEAVQRFGDLDAVRGECTALLESDRREERRREGLADLRQDITFGIRAARRAPLFSLLAIVSIALGVGANAAVFGVMKSVLLDALPYGGGDRIVRVWSRAENGINDQLSLTAGMVEAMSTRVRSFERSAVFFGQPQQFAFSTTGPAHPMTAGLAGPGFFETLAVRPMLGRTFADDDARTGAAPVVLLTHAVWTERLGADPAIVGKTVRLNGTASTVVGVLPREFVSPMGHVDAWVPFNLAPHLSNAMNAHRRSWLSVVARLRPGVSDETAAREVADIGARYLAEHPEAEGTKDLYMRLLRDDLAGSLRVPLVVLTLSAAVVLVVTCANLAGALLSRTLGRRQELAVRIALGAGRARLVRQLLTESVLLSLVGGAVGVLVAWGGLALLRAQAPSVLPAYANVSLDPTLIGGAILLALLTGIAFGVAPAMAAMRVAPQGVLREEGRTGTGGRGTSRLRGALAAGQVALCVSLLACAMLLGRSMWLLVNEPLGFDPEQVFTASVKPTGSRYPTVESGLQFADELAARARTIPGVESVAFSSALPGTLDSRNGFTIDGKAEQGASDVTFVLFATVSEGYFETLRVALKEGRTFAPSDRIGTAPVVVISESMARRWWPNGGAVGARIRVGPDPKAAPFEIIGVVADVRNDLVESDAEPMAYSSMRQGGGADQLLVRTRGDAGALASQLQRELAAIDPALPLYQPGTLQRTIDDGLVARRVPMLLVSAFGGLALLLAAIGVYAMVANLVASRTREFGIRLALGAAPMSIATLVLRQCGAWIAAGVFVGGIGVLFVTRLVRGMLFGIAPIDPVSLGGALLLLVVAAALALYGPVRRAVRVDPMAVMH